MSEGRNDSDQVEWTQLVKETEPVRLELSYEDASYLLGYCALRIFRPIIGMDSSDSANSEDSVRAVKASGTVIGDLTDRFAMALCDKALEDQVQLTLNTREIDLLEKDLATQLELSGDEPLVQSANRVL